MRYAPFTCNLDGDLHSLHCVCAGVPVESPTVDAYAASFSGGEVDVLVAGVGTGGTITGIGRYFKQTKGKDVVLVAVEPVNSPVISQNWRHAFSRLL